MLTGERAAGGEQPGAPEQGLAFAASSDVGRVRASNQDCAYAGWVPGADGWLLLAVADGVGGHNGGEWASGQAIDYLEAHLGQALAAMPPADALASTMEAASASLWDSARIGEGIPGAATTLVAAVVRGREAWWSNIGDSRIYVLAGEAMTQVSEDHSWVAQQVRDGVITLAEAAVSPHRNIVTRSVGFERRVSADRGGPLALAVGQALLLCSDGLHGPVSESTIASVASSLPPEEAAARLVAIANEAGGPDNVTAVVCRVLDSDVAPLAAAPVPAAELPAEAPSGIVRRTAPPLRPLPRLEPAPVPAGVREHDDDEDGVLYVNPAEKDPGRLSRPWALLLGGVVVAVLAAGVAAALLLR